ncbi:disulfide bond formation protein DsbB [Virgibacillus natechei]|uniref:Probable disulfide formation protein n=1 Tax=Virgibacillus natechei TaxID=1216297 RepID=A0ABS4IF78_9BACI|nr:disulfide oxidoreductase [Virgibacillus natechei]MBP1968991.1 disulfide bond formation protein DsbB [Virgibacillus natechei]UZD14267.1 disulfide oxidoreductase [Virgibacillus natechei]
MKKDQLNENILFFIWGVSFIAVAGSLFYSEVIGYEPCELCWIQRIFMYPLVVIYGVAAIKKDISIALPGLILSGIGILISIYHYSIQKIPTLQAAGDACGTVSCNVQYVNYFGFITIPFLAGIAFIIIFVGHLIILKR